MGGLHLHGKNTTRADWEQVNAADVNHDGNIDIEDLKFIAQKILE
ncbi:dockerin type I domain-containing protein [Paenibacillus sp. HWE-109]